MSMNELRRNEMKPLYTNRVGFRDNNMFVFNTNKTKENLFIYATRKLKRSACIGSYLFY